MRENIYNIIQQFYFRLINYIPFITSYFFVGVLFAFCFYFLFIRKKFVHKLFFEKFRDVDIISTAFNFNDSTDKRHGNLSVMYKTKSLITFSELKNYSTFCQYLNEYFILCIKNSKNLDKDSFYKFMDHLKVSYSMYGELMFPGIYNKYSFIYSESYCIFSEKAAKFILDYLNNRDLQFSILLFQLSLNVRDDRKFISENDDQNLDSLDVYYHSFIRNKYDVLQLWYFMVDLNSFIKSDRTFKNDIIRSDKVARVSSTFEPFYLSFCEFLENFTKAILKDFSKKLSLIEKSILIFFIIKSKVYALNKNTPSILLNLISLLPITLLLFLINNTAYYDFGNLLLKCYIVLFVFKKGFYFFDMINSNTNNKNIKNFFMVCLKFFMSVILNLAVLTVYIYIFKYIMVFYPKCNFVFMSVCLTYVTTETLMVLFYKLITFFKSKLKD